MTFIILEKLCGAIESDEAAVNTDDEVKQSGENAAGSRPPSRVDSRQSIASMTSTEGDDENASRPKRVRRLTNTIAEEAGPIDPAG